MHSPQYLTVRFPTGRGTPCHAMIEYQSTEVVHVHMQVSEINQCTKVGQLHKSLSGGSEMSIASCDVRPSATEFVKASQLLDKFRYKTSKNSSDRNSTSLQSFAPASTTLVGNVSHSEQSRASSIDHSSSGTPILSSSHTINDIKPPPTKTTQVLADPHSGFCKASKLLPSHSSNHMTTPKIMGVEEAAIAVSAVKLTSPVGEPNYVVLDLTSEGEVVKSVKKVVSKTKTISGAGRKAKIDPKSKRITSFFEK